MSFMIGMPNVFDGFINGVWMSDTYREFRKHENPYNDQTIAELQLLRFATARSMALYDDETKHLYWKFLSPKDNLEREVYYDHYETMYATIQAAEKLAFTRWAEVEASRFVPTALKMTELDYAKIIPRHDRLTPFDFTNGTRRINVPERLMPIGSTNAELYIRNLAQAKELPPLLVLPVSQRHADFLRLWRKYSWLQDAAQTSNQIFSYDLASRYNQLNALQGASAKSHLLLINENIPVPTRATFLGWAQYSVLQFTRLINPDDYTHMCGFRPDAALTYVLPCMPWTKEHASGSLIRNDDSHADHSLAARSSGHKRDKFDRIEYGQWRVKTVLINEDGQSYTVADENLSRHKSTVAVIYQHINMLPIKFQPNINALYPMPAELTYCMASALFDPFMAIRTPYSGNWAFNAATQTDLPWRSISKFWATHFRFDEDESNRKIANRWMHGFEQCAAWWLGINSNKLNHYFLQAIKGMTPDKAPLKTKQGISKYDINLDSFRT